MKNIQLASLFKRIVAAAMDGLFAIFMFFMLVTFVTTPIARKLSNYDDCVMEIYQQEVSSHLYLMVQQNSSGAYVPIEVKDYTEKLDESSFKKVGDIYSLQGISIADYIRHLNYYYTVYLTGDVSRVELPKNGSYDAINDHFVSPTYNQEINGKLPKDIYTNRFFNTQIMGLSPEGESNISEFYEYPIVSGNPDYEGLPVLKAGVDEAAAREDMLKRVYRASVEFFRTDYINSRQNRIRSIQLWEVIPTYVLVVGSIYILIPLLSKDKNTLGKKTMNISVISSLGYGASKKQIFFRSVVFVAEITLSLFVLGYGIQSFATLGFGCVVLLAFAIFTKKHQAPHDFAALTMEIDGRNSVFFENAKQEEMYANRVETNIEKLNKYEPENPNIIQVGGTIIKDEFKPKKKKNLKQKSSEK